MKIEIQQAGGTANVFDVAPGNYSVGRDSDCAIRLPHADVDQRHSILILREDGAWVEDLCSATGTRIDDVPVKGRVQLLAGQKARIGPYELAVRWAVSEPVSEVTVARTEPPADVKPAASAPTVEPVAPPRPEHPVSAPDRSFAVGNESALESSIPDAGGYTRDVPDFKQTAAELEMRRSIKQQIHRELVDRLDVKRLSSSRIGRDELREKVLGTIKTIVQEVSARLPSGIEPESIAREVYNEAVGLGPLEEFLEDEDVTEIMVNGPNQVYVEKRGKLTLSGKTFMDDASVLAVIERIVSPIGRRIDESQPYVDARLPDGSRVNAIIHPLSLVGPCLTIRKFSKRPFVDKDLIRLGTVLREVMDFMRIAVMMRKNVIVSGGTGSGKTSLLNVLSCYIPNGERIVTIEDAAELRLRQEHVVRLEARAPNIEGKGAVTIRDLVRNALRMRPDRVVVGECRGGETLDMLQAMNTGHDGSLTTVHANSPRDVISRLETMVLMSGMDLPVRAIREQVASAVDLIIHESRFSDGSRKVVKVTEVVGLEGDQITMQDIFVYVQTGIGDGGRVVGFFRPTGAVPTFMEEVGARGLDLDRSIFDPMRQAKAV